MTLRHLNIFVTVCKENSITNAAKKLYLSQPAVSLAIREMEEYYHTKLFQRISHKLYLTQIGEKVYVYASQILTLFHEMNENIHESDFNGTLRIGASITIGNAMLPSYLKDFKLKYPHMVTKAIINSSDIIEQQILDNELDIGLIEGLIHSNSIIHHSFAEDSLIPICSPNCLLAKKDKVFIEDLQDYPLLLREKNSGTREIIESTFLIQGLSIEPLMESTSTKAIIDSVAQGLGISILPQRLLTEALEKGKVTSFIIEGITFHRKLYLIYHKNKYLSLAAKAFIQMCMPNHIFPNNNEI